MIRILQSIHQYDLMTFDWCLNRKYREHVVQFSRWMSFLADGPLYAVLGAIFLLMGAWDIAKIMALGFALERVGYKTFKGLFKRNRPPQAIPGFKSAIEPPDQFSFPSGHTSGAFFMATTFAMIYPPSAWILFPWAASVASARVFLGVHFPTDVIAGACMGGGVALGVANYIL